MKTQLIKLKGGAKLLYVPVKGVQGLHVYLDFNAGAYNDPKGKLGVAHFCEHILAGFDTKSRTKEERWSILRKFQGFNATTGREKMMFYIFTVKNHFRQALDLLTDPFANVLIEPDEFEREKKVILDEIATRVKTNGRAAFYAYNSCGVKEEHINRQIESPAGTKESVEKIEISDIHQFMDKYFTLNNMLMIVAGNIGKKELVKATKDFVLTRFKEGGEIGFRERDVLCDVTSKNKYIYLKNQEKGKSLIELHYPIDFRPCTGKIENNDYCRPILSQYLREQMFKALRLDNGLCYGCSSAVKRKYGMRKLIDSIECAEENLDRIIEEYLKYVASLPSDMDRTQFEKFKNKICESANYDVENLFQTSGNAQDFYERFGILNHDKVKKYDMHRFATVSYDEVNSLYKQVYSKLPQIIVVSSDEKYSTKEFEKDLFKKIKKAEKRA
ncbi:MAG: insulinase family protein [Clostridia bacterium]|nr:insulinase family protein [Clostridia bacterium]